MDLHDKREEMLDFLVSNLKGSCIERRDGDIRYSTGNDEYYIKTLSRQKDFPVDYSYNPCNFDEDRRRLLAIKGTIDSFIEDKNREGFYPVFLLLRAETSYDGYVKNNGHFLKQKIGQHNDIKRLDQLELVILQYMRLNDYNTNKRKKFGKSYRPELSYYNTKEKRLEKVWFSDKEGDMRLDACPVCGRKNGEVSHACCKGHKGYLRYVISRDRNRYEKAIWIAGKRMKDISLTKAELSPALSRGVIGLFR